MIDSTYSVSSFSGLVSSKRRLVPPPNSSARPKSRQMALAWPICRYPFGSGGKRVHTRPLYLLVFRSSIMMSRTKLEGRAGSGAGVVSGLTFDAVINFYLKPITCGSGVSGKPETLTLHQPASFFSQLQQILIIQHRLKSYSHI